MSVQAFAATFGADNTPENRAAYRTAAFDPAKQAAELADGRGVLLIAEVGARAASYARLKEGAPAGVAPGERPIEIVRLYGMQEWIGRGVGAAPMAACLANAERRGCDAVWLDVWEHTTRGRGRSTLVGALKK